MIVFDLKCAGAGHVFEAWFGSSEDYDGQKSRGLVTCPMCGSADIEKAAMAPAVPAKANAAAGSSGQLAMSRGEPDPAQMKGLLEKVAKEQARLLEKSDYVGTDFADEARSMHDGEQKERPIHGETSLDEAKSLLEDGIQVAPLPLPVRPPKSDN
jgi:hypothetical protein